MKPFYLNGRTGMTVVLDGPALRVLAPGRAASLYPLQRISRVITSGPVAWSTEALLACAERGITVTFLARDGAIQAYLFGEASRREGLFCRLRDLLDRPDWQARYSDWYRAMESRARRALGKRLGLAGEVPPRGRLEAALAEWKQRHVSPAVGRFIDRRLNGLLSALVAELLAEAGLTAERARGLGERLRLTEDLSRLLTWDLQLPIIELLDRQLSPPGAPPRLDDAELVRLFEGRSQRLRRLGRTVLNRLHGWLVEL